MILQVFICINIQVLSQSLSILRYVGRTFGLYPSDSIQAARVVPIHIHTYHMTILSDRLSDWPSNVPGL